MHIANARETQRCLIIRATSDDIISQFIGLLPFLEIQRHISLLTLQFQVAWLDHFRKLQFFFGGMRQTAGFEYGRIEDT
ncbi:hypothetical protein D3C73_1263830 [compost metagenome]